MKQPPLVVLSFAGLSPAAISCFGSSWNRSPVIDQIAATSCCWDRCLATSDNPDTVFHQLVAGLLGGRSTNSATIDLQTDVASVIDGTSDRYFDRIDLVACDPPSDQGPPKTDVTDTQLGRLFASAISRAIQNPPWEVLWIHSGFLTRCWDAPRDIFADDTQDNPIEMPLSEAESLASSIAVTPGREANLDDCPPSLFDSLVPPRIELRGDEHPDLVTAWMRTYGCQVQMLDLLIGALLDSLAELSPRVVVAGTSGFRLGQGGWIGHRVGPLRSRDVHVPILCSGTRPIRFAGLSNLELVAPIIAGGWSEAEMNQHWTTDAKNSSIVVNTARAAKNLTTPDWFYVCDQNSVEHLFSKPDDIDDFNDVARVRPDVVAELNDMVAELNDVGAELNGGDGSAAQKNPASQ